MNEVNSEKSSSEFLTEVLELKNMEEAFLVGRDGFIVESLVSNHEIDSEEVGASIAGGIANLLELESHLNTGELKEMYVEYGGKMLICVPVSDMLLAAVASDTSTLASMRFKLKKLIPESISF